MNQISLNNSKKFALISGDKNKIHTDKNFNKKNFLKETVVHGVNLVLIALIKFFKYKKKIKITNIKIDFKNYCLNGEKFLIKLKNDSILIKNELNNKVIIQLKYLLLKSGNNSYIPDILTKKIIKFYKIKNIKNYFNLSLMGHLINISHYIGNMKPGSGSLIHSINSNKVGDFHNSITLIFTNWCKYHAKPKAFFGSF